MLQKTIRRLPVDLQRLYDAENNSRIGALPGDAPDLIREPCILSEEGVGPVVWYLKIEENLDRFLPFLNVLKFDAHHRTAGLLAYSRIFGFSPRLEIRQFCCRRAVLFKDASELEGILFSLAGKICELYQAHAPSFYKAQCDLIFKEVKKDWRISQTPFTSGIINKTTALS